MSTQTSEKETIYTFNSEIIKKERCSKQVTISLLILLLSAAAIVFASLMIHDKTSIIYLLLITIGGFGLLAGLIKVLVGDNKLVYLPTHSPVKAYSIFINADEAIKLERIIENNDWKSLHTVAAQSRHAGVRLDSIISKDNKFASCQVFKFIPHNYEPVTKVFNLDEKFIAEFKSEVQAIDAKQ